MTLEEDLGEYGLFLRGQANLSAAENKTYKFPEHVRSVGLVGNIGSSYWPFFSRSAEFADGRPDPLDRWSRRIAIAIVNTHSVLAIFPFTGPPYFPFQQWARRAEALTQSPLGLMIHADYGLWHSYRFALLLDTPAGAAPVQAESPCLTCSGRPCLRSCPVEAFDGDRYNVDICTSYLRNNAAAECHDKGCLARYACPVASLYRYRREQNQFHLRAFLGAH